jgi:hypothetical protein
MRPELSGNPILVVQHAIVNVELDNSDDLPNVRAILYACTELNQRAIVRLRRCCILNDVNIECKKSS